MNEKGGPLPGEPVEALVAEKGLELFAFAAPFLEEKTLWKGLFRSQEEYRAAFVELKKFLWLCAVMDRPYPMMSEGIDGLWHQFILYTIEYHDFCDRFFGRYMHHRPSGPRPASATASPETKALGMEFFRAYQKHFGPVPRLWLDRPAAASEFLAFADDLVSNHLAAPVG